MDSNSVRNDIERRKKNQIHLFFSDESPQKFVDYRPVFFEGHPLWFQEPSTDRPVQTGRSMDERQPSAWPTTRVY
jgi:hypothetical protein